MKKIFSYSKSIIAVTSVLFLLGSIAMVSPKTLAVVNPSISVTSIQDDVTIYYPEFNFSCPTNPLFSPVIINGEGVGIAPPGQIDQYHVQVVWGDGEETNGLGVFTPSSGQGSFSFTFEAGPHSYDNDNYTIIVRLYHSQPPGNDNQADTVISIPICVVTEPPILNVFKQVINDDEGTLAASDFNLHVKIDGQEAPNSPQPGSETGTEYTLAPGTYVVSEDKISGYTQTFSGDCDSQGSITLISGDVKSCTITNDDIPVGPYCGDGTCDTNETCSTCSADCGACPIDGGWTEWGTCSQTCGGGTQTRTCTNPEPQYGGAVCAGDSQRICSDWPCAGTCPTSCGYQGGTVSDGQGGFLTCDATTPCPIDGGWTEWGTCSQTCGGGTQTRTCTNPEPANGGNDCVGDVTQTCNTQDCPLEPECESGDTITCSTDLLGVCSAGTQTCGQSGFWGECVQNVQPMQEICGNGVDEDCNGSNATCHSRSGQFMPPAEPEGRVLGEATTTVACGIYLLKYIKYGADNDPAEVMKLQIFLNEFMGDNLTVNGIYDQETLNAVNQFQLAYKEEVLRPWVLAGYLENENTPTGYVYLTTKRWINLLECPSLNIPMPNLVPDLTGSSLGLGENNGEVLGEEKVLGEEATTTVGEQPEEASAPVEEAVSEETGIPTTTEKEGSNWLTIIFWIIVLAVILGLAAWAYKKK